MRDLALWPLRFFLGFTFLYAGLSKIFDRVYLDPSSPLGVKQQMLTAAETSPIGAVVRLSAEYSTFTGLAIAFGEVAIGAAVLVGFWTRVAAIGGALLALSFFLTISWNVSPYYLGADIFVAFAWTPLAIVGDHGRFSIANRLRTAVRRRWPEGNAERRTMIIGGSIATTLAAAGVSVGSAVALGRRGGRRANNAAVTGLAIVPVAELSVGESLKFTTSDGGMAYLLHPAPDSYLAFRAACTHQGCPVSVEDNGFRCPCHGGKFDRNGQVTGGPPPAPLARIPVRIVDGVVTTA
ncbi:Rieske 2Fe-2S domain-containing protein [Jidongwangia harbinensis]|uniref:Rieske 2Fe-2S domain-containing protein n=1 Tax=Jidongwangia harbinensis TaxID=2878561 RepID=UPI001CD9E632|nr:Rieske 2Fe-2S domain-containing protein [Jidongwangia harbinensis]MCA2215527.1 Rieske 2Fe-2S domain-containing protein [Jidongwangia harbinensis]